MFAGIDIGGTNIKFGIIDQDGLILFQNSISTHPEKGPEFMIQCLHSIIESLTLAHPGILSFGIGFPSAPTHFPNGHDPEVRICSK